MRQRWRWGVVLLVGVLVTLSASASAVPTATRVTFLSVGDISANASASGVLTAIGQDTSDLTLVVGDLSYGVTGQEQAWCDFVTARVGAGYPFELLAGNHESNGLNGNINDFSSCLPNQLPGLVGTYGRQYYVDVPQVNPLVRYVMISPSLGFPNESYSYPAGSARYNWTAAAIDGARAASIPWVVVGMHKPCISVGTYGCDVGADLFNLLISKKVDLVLSGHEHLYQRSKQLAHGAGCAALQPTVYNAACVKDADSAVQKGAGLVSVTVGTGGVGLREVNPDDTEAGYFVAVQGSNQTPSHGYLKVSATPTELSGGFVRTDGTFDDDFTITEGVAPPNQPPVASFTSSCSNLVCTFDGAASSDPDGGVTGYAWSFGDGTPAGSGMSVSHTFPAAGSYPVTLTVTDNANASSAPSTQTVVVTAPTGPTYFARDDFTRAVATGWGTATLGGAWTTPAGTSVSNGSGALSIAAGADKTVLLPGGTAAGADLRATIWADKTPNATMQYNVIGRRVVSGTTVVGDYRALVKMSATGSVTAGIAYRPGSGAEVVLAPSVTVPGLTIATGEKLHVRMRVTGGSPTTLQLKVWKAGTTEPATWTNSVTNNQAGLQAAGSTGFRAYLSSSASNGPVVVRVDDWAAEIVP